MGLERDTRLKWKGETIAGRALLETDEIIVRGPSRVVIPLKDVKKATAVGGWLVLDLAKGCAELELGEAADAWATKISNPKGRVEKLGIVAEMEIAIVGDLEPAFIDEAKARGAVVKSSAPSKNAFVVIAASSPKDLARVGSLAERIAPEGALWIVYPKGRKDIRENDVIGAGRAAKLHDVKVARFSETHTALKFVVPKSARK